MELPSFLSRFNLAELMRFRVPFFLGGYPLVGCNVFGNVVWCGL
jgi:hypothetical protein